MDVAIVGGTGTVGAEAARELCARGHDVRVLSRHAPEYPVDVATGEGLARALADHDQGPLTAAPVGAADARF